MKLKEYRVSSGMTQEQVADALGIPKRTYQNYEYGMREPDSEVLCALADLYGATVDGLVGRVMPSPELARHDELASLYDSMDERARESLLVVARSLAERFPRKG